MKKKTRDYVNTTIPKEFLIKVDEARVRAGFNSRERNDFLRMLSKREENLFENIVPKKKEKGRGGFNFGSL